jgi:hypothetical protein
MDRQSGGGIAPKGRPLAADLLDRRTKEWRRRCELIDQFTAALGGPQAVTGILAMKIEQAAELAVVAELARAAFIRGEAMPADDVVRTANQAARAEKALGIKHRTAKPEPDLQSYLAGKAA